MKKSISVLLAVLLMAVSMIPAFNAIAAKDPAVSVTAEAEETIQISKQTTLPGEDDFNGILELAAGTFNVERDYSQYCYVNVTNTAEVSMEYYLTVSNVYSDIYLNFVRSGSIDSPIVIGAGETQQIRLDLFMQNAQQGEYTLPVYAYTVVGEEVNLDAKVTVEIICPVVDLKVSLTKGTEDVNTLAQQYTLTNIGQALSDVTVSVTGEAADYTMLSPYIENIPMKNRESVLFTASPDLTKMKTNNTQVVEGELVVSSGGKSYSVPLKFDTNGQEIITTTMGELAALQNSNFETNSLSTQSEEIADFTIDINNTQCTNAGKVTSSFYVSPTGSKGSVSTNADDDGDGVRMFVTSRMYGGGYVNKTKTNYDYYLNGKKVAVSHNSGLTELSMAELPTDALKFGSTNTLVRDYDTNPGSHFVTASTQIVLVYPGTTPISYIGSPKTLPDVRSLSDFAVYTENIFNKNSNVLVGNSTTVSINVYNKGSAAGYFDIEVSDGENIIYSEKARYLDGFSSDTVEFDWIPEKASTEITVKLINVNENNNEKNTTNNTATATLSARTRVVPSITSITPEFSAEGESVVFATVANHADVTKVEFYVDDVLYEGEVKSSAISGSMRYWINDTSMGKGSHDIKVVVYYATGTNTTASIEATSVLTVLEKDWNKYTFEVGSDIYYPSFYVLDTENNSSSGYYNFTRDGSTYSMTMSKAMYDSPEKYSLAVVSSNSIIFKDLSNTDRVYEKTNGNELTFASVDGLYINNIKLESINDISVSWWMDNTGSYILTPAKYSFRISMKYLGEYKTVSVTADLTDGNKTIDLRDYFSKYIFKFADQINGYPEATMYFRYSNASSWQSFMLSSNLNDSEFSCVVPAYNQSQFDYAEEAFITVVTNDIVLVLDVKPVENNIPSTVSIDKNNLQKYTLSANGGDIDFDFSEIRVNSERFAATLNSPTVYLTHGEYEISVISKDPAVTDISTMAVSDEISTQAVSEEDCVSLSVNWSDAYLENHATLYVTGSKGSNVSRSVYRSDSEISVEKDVYTIETNIVRNNSYYSVIGSANALNGDAEVTIGDSFSGTITNSFGSYSGNSSVRLYLDDLTDENGNELAFFNSQDSKDNLKGYVMFTNVHDSDDVYTSYVELSNVSGVDVVLPNTDGEYAVSLVVSTNADVFRPVDEIILSDEKLTLNGIDFYRLTATLDPVNATYQDIVWSTSDKEIAYVTQTGLIITMMKEGTVEITASTPDGEVIATCEVTVVYRLRQLVNWIIDFFKDLFQKINVLFESIEF